MFLRPCGLFRYLFRYTCSRHQFTTLEMRWKLFQVNFRKDFGDCHWRQRKNWPIAGQRIFNDNPGSLCKSKLSQGSLPHLEWQMGLALSIRILFTVGNVVWDIGRHSGRYSGRQSVDIAVDSRSIVGRQSVDSRSIVGRMVGRWSVDSRSIVGR